tara:strand:- start:1401 stop:2351 length:951 start_codon:yes stop_codon:yes gene_type:complete
MKIIKPKFWDLKKPNILALLLLPLTTILIINNLFLNLKKKKKFKKIKSICVGNIYVGGTGKTQSSIKIYNILKKLKYNVVVGKKFYNNQLDEITLLKKYSKVISLNSRSKIIDKAKKDKNQIIIFDDGLQDREISYDLQVVCFDTKNLIGNGNLLPSGPLREKIQSLKKYDCIIFKDDINKAKIFSKKVIKLNKKIKIFYSYTSIKNLKKFKRTKKYLIFSGIGNPDSFKNILKNKNLNIVKELVFPDHHNYKEQDIKNIKNQAKRLKASIITTEKDFVKLSKNNQKGIDFVKVEINFYNEKYIIKYLKSKLDEKN